MDLKIAASLLSFTFLACIIFFLNLNSSPKGIKVGNKIPSISLKDETGKLRNLSEFIGNKVVLYFYPKDDTPGCTKEACSLRNQYEEFTKRGIVIIGVSYDSPKSHKKFKEKYNLPFTLLSDKKKKAAKAFGAYKGILKYFVPARITFLINENGEITHIIDNVDVTTHADKILELLNNIN